VSDPAGSFLVDAGIQPTQRGTEMKTHNDAKLILSIFADSLRPDGEARAKAARDLLAEFIGLAKEVGFHIEKTGEHRFALFLRGARRQRMYLFADSEGPLYKFDAPRGDWKRFEPLYFNPLANVWESPDPDREVAPVPGEPVRRIHGLTVMAAEVARTLNAPEEAAQSTA
jgi:hypothetical protein